MTADLPSIPDIDSPPNTPMAWISQQIEHTDGEVPVYNFRIQARERAGDRWKVVCAIRRKPADTPQSLFDRITVECDRQNAVELRVIATTRQAQTPVSTYLWATDYIGNPNAEEPVADDETASAAMMRQALRHNEQLLGALMKVCGAQVSAFTAMQGQAKAQQDAAWSERIEMMHVMRNLYFEKDEREVETKKWDALAQAGTTFAQAAAYKMTQGNVAPDAKANILDSALLKLGATITPEQAEALGGILSQEQLVMLNALTTKPADTAEKVRKVRAEAEHEARVAAAAAKKANGKDSAEA